MKISRLVVSVIVFSFYCFSLFFGNIPLVQAASVKATPDKIFIAPGQKITVTFSGGSGHYDAHIQLMKVSPQEGSSFLQRLDGKRSGTLEFNAPEDPGTWEFVMRDNYVVTKSNLVNVEFKQVTLSHSVSTHFIGRSKKIEVNFKDAPGYSDDIVRLIRTDIPNPGDISLQFCQSKTNGTLVFNAPEDPGTYEFHFNAKNRKDFMIGKSSSFKVAWGPVSMRVTVHSADAQGGRKLTVHFSGAPGYFEDRISLMILKPYESTVRHESLGGKTNGSVEFNCSIETGTYELSLFGKGIILLGKTQPFIPKNGPPPPLEQQPDPTPPPAPDKPFTLRAYPGDGKVFLEWTPPQNTSNIIGYNLYRKTSRIPYGSPITDFPIKGLNHTDMNVDNGMQACYYMKAVYSDKTESAASNEVCVTPGAGADGKIIIVLTIGSKNAYVNQQLVVLDVAPFIDSGRTFVPFRFVGESLGAEVGFTTDASGRVATVTYRLGSTNIILYIGRKDALVNGRTVYLDVAPKIVQGRTVIPLRFVTEALGCKVDWDGQAMQVTIQYPA